MSNPLFSVQMVGLEFDYRTRPIQFYLESKNKGIVSSEIKKYWYPLVPLFTPDESYRGQGLFLFLLYMFVSLCNVQYINS